MASVYLCGDKKWFCMITRIETVSELHIVGRKWIMSVFLLHAIVVKAGFAQFVRRIIHLVMPLPAFAELWFARFPKKVQSTPSSWWNEAGRGLHYFESWWILHSCGQVSLIKWMKKQTAVKHPPLKTRTSPMIVCTIILYEYSQTLLCRFTPNYFIL